MLPSNAFRRMSRSLAGFSLALCLLGCTASPRWHGPPTAHFDGERFLTAEPFDKGLLDLLRYYATREPGEWQRLDRPPGPPPPARVANEALRLTVVNHATVLVQADGINLLTDPIWSERAGPVSWAGPRRHLPPGIAFDDLPAIDAVIISHNHYDHLDLPTLLRLQRHHDPLFVVGLGDGEILGDAGIRKICELDWWQTIRLPGGNRLVSIPVQHWSQRQLVPSDRNLSLWQGFVLETTGGPVYFAGDTGYGPHFSEARRRLGPMRAALLPIGAYEPRWLTEFQHMDPGQGVQAHQDLAAQQSIGIHWGTFELADESQFQPPRDLRIAVARAGLAADAFIAPRFGTAVTVPALPYVPRNWHEIAPAPTGQCRHRQGHSSHHSRRTNIAATGL